jgi:hypothetical protein
MRKRTESRGMKLLGVLILGILLWAVPALHVQGATATGIIVGTVTDASGAAIPGATVTATQQETGTTRSMTTGAAGDFSFPQLPVGHYTLKVSKSDFRPYTQKDILLQVDQSVTLHVTLALGTYREQVTVTATGTGINLVSATVSEVVDQRRIVDLPLNGRDPLQLQFIMPGVTFDTDNVAHGQGQHEGVVINGNRPASNNYLLDGLDYNDSYLAVAPTFPAPDALQEFSVQAADFNAQYGRSAGGVINAVTKSGTNEWHGDLFEFLRNTALNANNFFANKAGQTRPSFQLNQFGGTLGGPLKKDKTFVFGYYQGTRQRKGNAITIPTVLTAQERPDLSADESANFSDICPGPQCPVDPRTGQPFPGNVIPANRIDPTAVKFIHAIMPLPNEGRSYVFNAPFVGSMDDLTENQFLVRVDHTIDQKNRMFGRYFYNNDNGFGLGAGSNIPGNNHTKLFRNQDVALNWTHTFSPTLLNSASLGWNRLFHNRFPDINQSWGTFGGPPASIPSTPRHRGDLYVGISGSLGTSGDGTFLQNRTTSELSDVLSWVKGRHTVNAGLEYRRTAVNRFEDFFTDPTMSFSGQFTGNPLADLLLGLPSSFREDTEVRSELRHTGVGVFGQDTFKARPSLTFDLGLRWEPYLPPVDNLNDQICLDPTFTKKSSFYPTAPPGILFPGGPINGNFGSGDSGCPRQLIPTRWKNFAPRVGLAWDPFKNGKTSVRAAYGVFWDQIRLIGYNRFSTAQPFDNTVNIFSPGNPTNDFLPSLTGTSIFTNSNTPDPYPYILPRTPAQRAAYDPFFGGNWPTFALEDALNPNWNEAYVQEWNFSLQREIIPNWNLTVAYLGNRSTHDWISREYNWAVPLPLSVESAAVQRSTTNQRRRLSSILCSTATPGVAVPCYGPFEEEDDPVGSNYNSLQVTINKRFSRGLTLLGSYVWSKTLDVESFGAEGGSGPRDPLNLYLNYGLSDMDVPQRFEISYIWQIPKISRFSGATDRVLNGWQVNGITTIQTGTPFTISTGIDTALYGVGGDHADQVPGVSPFLSTGRPDGQKIQEYFNTAAFREPADATFGTVGRNTMIGPGIINFDFSLFKDFLISERWGRFQFRSEFFNLFNTPNFFNPDGSITDGSAFGQIFSARDPRFVQFALKWIF